MSTISNYKYKSFIYIFVIAILIFSLKWLASFYYFPDENISAKIINDSHKDSYMYFHYIKSLTDFNFNKLYNGTLIDSELMSVPFGAILIHAFFYKFIGIASFIFLEFLSIFIFLIIFFKIFKKLQFSFYLSIMLSLLFFMLPLIISNLNNFEISEINTFTSNFYNLRFPRPLVANLFLFYFIFLLIEFNSESSLKMKTLINISIVAVLSMSSFFFFFITEVIAFTIVLIIKINKDKKLINKKNIIKIFYCFTIFIILAIPFFYFFINGSADYSERIGLIDISFLDKKYLLEHYISKLFRLKLIMVYIVLISTFIVFKKFYPRDFNIIKIFYIFFISSILGPLFFIIMSNKVAYLYHFNNTVVILIVLLFLMTFILILKNNFNFYVTRTLFFVFSFLILVIYNINSYNTYKKEIENIHRQEINKLFNTLSKKNIDIKNLTLLTFDQKIMTWAILNEIKNINLLDGTFSPRSSKLTDQSLIEAFKFLKLGILDYKNFLENKKIGYRYINHDARSIYWQRYQANSLTTFKKSNDFNTNILRDINQSSPFYAHQFAIPNFELKRLSNLFLFYSDKTFNDPNLIIINNNVILNKSKINKNKYCTIIDGKTISAYLEKNLC